MYEDCLEFIEQTWERLTFRVEQDKQIHIGLPHPFVAPTSDDGIFQQDQFYWDSFFIIVGLPDKELAKGMVDNFLYLHHRFNIIPSRNRFYNLGISQPPFLTSMILEIDDEDWQAEAFAVAEREMNSYWMDEFHFINGLSRYCDHYVIHETAEHESGWDMTSRFNKRCLDFLPVDLNALLYKYEIDIANFFVNKDKTKHEIYLERAKKRAAKMKELMFRDGFFYDYDYIHKKTSDFKSLAGFYPMFAGMLTQDEAEQVKSHLVDFECKGGLANTQSEGLYEEYKQWDHPNGWAPQQYIVVQGLLRYGFDEDAKRIAHKWCETNYMVFSQTGKMWEKYNVVEPGIPKVGRYENQVGFGWTNAIFWKFCQLFDWK